MLPEPLFAVTVPPVQVVEALAGVATTTPVGRVSLKSRLVADKALLELLIVKVRVLVPPPGIAEGAKALLKDGGEATVKVSEAVPLLPEEEVSSPVVLTCEPTLLPVTFAWTVQFAPALTEPPL